VARFTFDEFELDTASYELRRAGRPVSIEPQVFEVLSLLIENAGRVVTKEEILDHVWPERYVTEAALNSRVMSARKALGDSGQEQRYIKTVHGRGYRFALVPTLAEERSPVAVEPRKPTVDHAPPEGPTTSFVGRNTELARLVALVGQPSCRLVTIFGPGGIGKTRLALRVLEELRSTNVEALYLPLENTNEGFLAASLATALGMQPQGDALTEVLRTLAGRELVLILDNVEHLVPEAVQLLTALLTAAPKTRVALTSRAVLGLHQEWVFRVEGLSCEADEDEGTPEAVELFLERQRQADASAPTASKSEARAICELVQGMPLAIELAAALVRHVPAADIPALIANDASALETTLHDMPERHRSIATLFAEGRRRLSPDDDEVLRALAVFEGPFDLAAAREVAGASLSLLRGLSDRSLIQSGESGFRLHPLMRQLLADELGDRMAPLRTRHATVYALRAANIGRALQGPGQLEAAAAGDRDSSNLMAAWRWAAASGDVATLELARRGLFTHLTVRGRITEGEALARMALQIPETEESQPMVAGLLVHHFWALLRMGRIEEALVALERAGRVQRQAGIEWQPGFGSDFRVAIAALRIGSGDYKGAHEIAEAALALARKHGDMAGTAFAAWLACAGRLRRMELECVAGSDGRWTYRPTAAEVGAGHLARGEDLARIALSILEEWDETWLRGYVEIEANLIAGAHGDTRLALRHLQTAYQLREAVGDQQGMGGALVYLADFYCGTGDLEEAMCCAVRARELAERTSDATGLAEAARSTGNIAAVAGDFEAAEDHLCEALERSIAAGFANNVLGSLRAMAPLVIRRGNISLAATIFATVSQNASSHPMTRARAAQDLMRLAEQHPVLATAPASTAEILSAEVLRALGRESRRAVWPGMARPDR